MVVEFLRDEENLFLAIGRAAEQSADLLDDRFVASSRFRLKAEILDPIVRQPGTDFSGFPLEFFDHSVEDECVKR